ncbi:transglutaminase family protein [Ampullimonas aquatilis]|uniref:transglutaminase family protein n=1 Tax=Ampullimonas aquatilis TaxID=1341549 RepID=UPI003C76A635
MRLAIRHLTTYQYGAPVRYAISEVRLSPRRNEYQEIHRWKVSAPAGLRAFEDGYFNACHSMTVTHPISYIDLLAQGEVSTNMEAGQVILPHPKELSPYIYVNATELTQDEPKHLLRDFSTIQLARIKAGGPYALEALINLADDVATRVTYTSGSTNVNTTAIQAFLGRAGVCQDQAHVYLACCRAHGVPARYVSGYFYAANAPELASHAWVDVWVEGTHGQATGWYSIDITHRCFSDERHVRLAVGKDYASVSPIRGMRTGGGRENLSVKISIMPV